MKKLSIILLLFIAVFFSACAKKTTNQNINSKTKSQKTLEYFCNLPKVPADYIKDCENFRKGVNSGLIE